MSTSFISKENMLDISNGMYDYNENTYQHKNTLVDKVKEAIENGEIEVGEKVVVDSTLNSSSTNPIQNKIVKAELDNKQDKLTPGGNIQITDKGVISAIIKTYTAGYNITISKEGKISATGELTNEQKTNVNKIPDLEKKVNLLLNPLVKPTWSFTTDTYLYEKGSTISPKLKVAINSKGNANITSIVYKRYNTVLDTQTYVDGTTQYICNKLVNITEPSDTNTIILTAILNYNYNDTEYSDVQKIKIKFVSPLFKGVLTTNQINEITSTSGDTIRDLISVPNNKILQETRAITINGLAFTNSRVVYMYPSNLGDLTSIKDANNFEVLNSFTKLSSKLNKLTYNIYVMTDTASLSNGTLIFK